MDLDHPPQSSFIQAKRGVLAFPFARILQFMHIWVLAFNHSALRTNIMGCLEFFPTKHMMDVWKSLRMTA